MSFNPLTIGAVLNHKHGTKDPMKKKAWMGSKPTHCDICRSKLKKVFIDGRTAFGPWAIMCEMCHRDQGNGLGLGKGQKYDLETLEKIE